MTYPETLQYLYIKLPMFTRVGAPAFKKDLTNTIALCEGLNNPQNKFKTVHVGGTNGKGSTSHMLAAILQTAGYKTGLYTSPHLLDFRERIRINGQMIPEQEVIDFVARQQPAIDRIEPSFFELTVAMAFDHFAKERVDVAIIEVGLGGRLDSTNIISPLLSVITNISYDHMNMLGNTLQEIAAEKAGIIKQNTPVVIGQWQQEVAGIFLAKSAETSSEISFADQEWQVTGARNAKSTLLEAQVKHHAQKLNLQLDLTGTYQLKNLPGVLEAVKYLKEHFSISDAQVAKALGSVGQLTGLMGRWQTLQTEPLIIADTGHNEDGIGEVLKNIALTPHKTLHFILGMVKDKDISKILNLLPKKADYYFCHPKLERAKPAVELAREASAAGLHGGIYDSVKDAVNAAKNRAKTDDLIFIGGSTFVVAEALDIPAVKK